MPSAELRIFGFINVVPNPRPSTGASSMPGQVNDVNTAASPLALEASHSLIISSFQGYFSVIYLIDIIDLD